MVGDQNVSDFDIRKGLGITLLAGAIIALNGCSAESETVAAVEGGTSSESSASPAEATAPATGATALTSGTSGTSGMSEEEARRRFAEASQAALSRAVDAGSSDAAPTRKSAATSSAGVGATAPVASGTGSGLGATAPTGSAPKAAPKTAPQTGVTASRAAAPAPAPAFNMTGGSAADEVVPAKPAVKPVAGSADARLSPLLTNNAAAAVAPAPARTAPTTTTGGEVLTPEARRAKTAALEARRAATANGVNVAPAVQAAAPQTRQDGPPSTGITLEPAVLEFGDIPLGDSKILTVKLVNNSEFPFKLIDCRATCGCTTTQCPKGDTIPPNGGAVEVEIKLDGGERAQKLRKTVSFLISDNHPPLRLALDANAVAYVDVTPERLDRGEHPDGTVTISSADGTPFRILSMFPPVLMPDDFSDEAKTEHTVNVPWDALYETGSRQRRLLFRLDHPRAERAEVPLSVNVQRDMRERARANGEGNVVGANAPAATARDLNGMLEREEYDAVLALIANDEVAINQPDKARHTPMIKAARYGAVEVMMALADKGSNLEATDGMGRTPISYAAQSGSLDAVLTLLDLGANVNHVDQTGNTPLGWAAGFGTVGMCEAMIEAGAKVNAGEGTLLGFTPLIWASMASTDVDKVKLLIENKADLEARDTMEQATVVMHAIRTNMLENAKALIEAGAKLDVTDARGRTPLHIAAGNGAPDAKMIEFLLSKGLDPAATTRNGETAVDLAMKRRDAKAGEVIAALEKAMGG